MEGFDERWERLKAAKEAMAQGLASALSGSSTPESLGEALIGVYESAQGDFGTVSAERVFVSVGRDSVLVRCGDGSVEVYDEEGWRSRLTGLRGRWLVALLGGWPAFHVPESPPVPVNEALVHLRGLLHDADESVFEEVWGVIEAHADPTVRAYVFDHAERWPPALSRAFFEHPQLRFAALGVSLLRQQIAEGLGAIFESETRDSPGELILLRDLLIPFVEGARGLWNAAMGTRADFDIIFEYGSLRVFDRRAPEELGVDLFWDGRWMCERYRDGKHIEPVEGILEMLCARFDPLAEDNWMVEEAQIQEAEAFHARTYYGEGYVEDEVEEAPWEEDENWRMAFVYEGLDDKAPVPEEEEGWWSGPSERILDGEEVLPPDWYDDEY